MSVVVVWCVVVDVAVEGAHNSIMFNMGQVYCSVRGKCSSNVEGVVVTCL